MPASIRPGDVLADRYRLVDLLSESGNGRFWRAHDRVLERHVALHVIEANAVTPAILGRRFTMNPVMILLAFSYFSWIWGAVGALLSVPILLMVTAFFDHVGRPNLVGFIFGEPLFQTPLIEDAEGSAEETRPA